MPIKQNRIRTILLAILLFLVVVLIGLLIYRTFFKSDTTEPIIEQPSIETPDGQFPTSGQAKPKEITEGVTEHPQKEKQKEKVIEDLEDIKEITPEVSEVAKGGFTKTNFLNNTKVEHTVLNKNKDSLFVYNPDDSKFYKMDNLGNLEALSDKKFHNVSNVTWSPNKDEGILEYPDGSNIVYNFETEEQVTLPRHWQDFSFSDSGKDIAFKSYANNPEDNWLAISKNDGSNPIPIEPLGENGQYVDVKISPTDQIVATFRKPSTGSRQEIYFIGKNKENFKLTMVEGYNFKSQWSPDGKKMLYSVTNQDNNNKPQIWIVNAHGESIGSKRTKLPITSFADRCVFDNSGNNIYCAEPIEMPNNAGVLTSFLKNSATDEFGQPIPIPSMIVKVNIHSKAKDIIAIPDELSDIDNIYLNDKEDLLFYTDNEFGLIRKIKLK